MEHDRLPFSLREKDSLVKWSCAVAGDVNPAETVNY